MSFTGLLWLVPLAAFGGVSLAISLGVAVAWRLGLAERRWPARRLLGLRLLPVLGGVICVGVVLPVFLIHEPRGELERVGVPVLAMAALALVTLADGMRRGWRAWSDSRLFLSRLGPIGYLPVAGGGSVSIIDCKYPIVAAVGVLRTRLVAAEAVRAELDADEWIRVMAHEVEHLSARDNLKAFLLSLCPDALAWLPAGTQIAEGWRVASELEADERSTGADRGKRLNLASALIKVARLSAQAEKVRPALSMAIAEGQVAGRVERLLAHAETTESHRVPRWLIVSMLFAPPLAVSMHAWVYRLIEMLVGLAR